MIRPNMLKKYTAPLAPNHSDDPSGTQPQRAQSVQRRTSEQPVPSKGKKKGSRRKFNSDSVNAPYEKLVPIPEDDNAMDTSTADIVPDVKFNDILVPDAASLHCVYCHDVGSYIWECQGEGCGNTVCVGKQPGDHGCIDASPDVDLGKAMVTMETFLCPQCYRANKKAVPYKIAGYSVRHEFMFRNYFPLLAIFLTWSGFGREFASDIVLRTLQEHFHLEPNRLCTASRKIKKGNNRPHLLQQQFDWFARLNQRGNILIFVNTHSDSETGQLVASGSASDPRSVPAWELLEAYLGNKFIEASHAIQKHNASARLGPFIRGLVICACGATGRVKSSVDSLSRLVERNVFDFILCFAGASTLDSVVTPALTRFVENVFVYDMDIWTALEQSFGEDRHALNSSPVMLSFAVFERQPDGTRRRIVHTRVLALSNLRDARPWGLHIYQCHTCRAPAHNMIFHPDGHQFVGAKWLQTKIRYKCLACGASRRSISTPPWVHRSGEENFGRVWYAWPLSSDELKEIGVVSVVEDKPK